MCLFVCLFDFLFGRVVCRWINTVLERGERGSLGNGRPWCVSVKRKELVLTTEFAIPCEFPSFFARTFLESQMSVFLQDFLASSLTLFCTWEIKMENK